MYHIPNLTVEIEVMASTLRRQERRFHDLILELEQALINRHSAEDRIRSIENELRCLAPRAA